MSETETPKPLSASKKRYAEWLLFAVIGSGIAPALQSLIANWWHNDVAAKELYTREWHSRVNAAVDKVEAQAVVNAAVRDSIPRLERQLDELTKKVDEVRTIVAREQGRRDAATTR